MNTTAITQAGPAPLPPALQAQRFMLNGLNCYVAGEGPPLLLVHSINAAASAAEMRPLFEHYRRNRTVFVPDLPGFGLSERGDRRYNPRLMTDALQRLVGEIRRRCGEQPVDALALSLGCEFLARAAVERPALWGRLALVSPTGLDGRHTRRDRPGSTRAIPGLHALLRQRWWAQALFRLLTRPSTVRYFLQRTWGSEAIDETLWAYAVQSAQQPGARFAPLHFLSGGLFSADIHRVYENLLQPVWMSHGVRGDFVDYRGIAQLHGFDWRFTVFPTGAMTYFERLDEFCARLDMLLDSPLRDLAQTSAEAAGLPVRKWLRRGQASPPVQRAGLAG